MPKLPLLAASELAKILRNLDLNLKGKREAICSFSTLMAEQL